MSCALCGWYGGNHAAGCANNTVAALLKQKEYIRVVTTTGWWFDMDKPEGFNMGAFVLTIRANDYLMNERLYVPIASIEACFVWSEDKPPKQADGVVLSFPGKLT